MLNPYQILFEKVYYCSTTALLTADLDEMEVFGRGTTEHPVVDAAVSTAPIVVAYTPAKIAELVDRGHWVTILELSDAEEIYRALEDHLARARSTVSTRGGTLNQSTLPLDDLKLLDGLAAMIHDNFPSILGKHRVKEEVTRRNLMDRIREDLHGVKPLGERDSNDILFNREN